jgi:hypothetical protein
MPKAQRTFAKTHDAAMEQYGEGERLDLTEKASLRHTHEKRDGRWVPKGRPGPDVDQSTKQELYERARRLGVEGRSKMSKRELARAVAARQ